MSVSILNARAQAEGWKLKQDAGVHQQSFVVSFTVDGRIFERAAESVKAARKLASMAALLDVAGEEAADPVSRLHE